MTEHLDVGSALIDLTYYRGLAEAGHTLSTADALGVLAAAEGLAAALDRIEQLVPSRIGAGDFLAGFEGTPGGFDDYAFYQGVSFALAKAHALMKDGHRG